MRILGTLFALTTLIACDHRPDRASVRNADPSDRGATDETPYKSSESLGAGTKGVICGDTLQLLDLYQAQANELTLTASEGFDKDLEKLAYVTTRYFVTASGFKNENGALVPEYPTEQVATYSKDLAAHTLEKFQDIPPKTKL